MVDRGTADNHFNAVGDILLYGFKYRSIHEDFG
jgi:hypothetical protein